MTNITAKQIAEFRAKTGLPMMECKKALVEANGDEAKAMDILKKKGMAKAESRAARVAKSGIVDSYIHGAGKIGVLVEVNSETDFVAKNEEFKEFVHNIALHIAAMNPKYISSDQIPREEIEKETKLLSEQAKAEGKPDNIISKIVEGRLEKYYSEVCLLNQPFVKDPDNTIEDLLTEKRSKIGENIVISRFVRFELGS